MIDATKLRPMNDWVLLKLDPEPEKVGSIYLPQGVHPDEPGAAATGVIVALGPGRPSTNKEYRKTGKKYVPLDLKVGVRVMFRRAYGIIPAYDLEKGYALVGGNDPRIIYGEILPE